MFFRVGQRPMTRTSYIQPAAGPPMRKPEINPMRDRRARRDGADSSSPAYTIDGVNLAMIASATV
jgi:hypothetical protein